MDSSPVISVRYAQALAKCSRLLLAAARTDTSLDEALAVLREAADVARVRLFEAFTDPVAGQCLRLRAEVCAPGVPPGAADPRCQRLPCTRSPCVGEILNFQAGRVIAGGTGQLSPAAAAVLAAQGVIAALAIPIFAGGQWYGVVGCHETRQPRQWLPEDEGVLRIAAEMLGSYLERQCGEAALRANELRFRTIVVESPHVAVLGCSLGRVITFWNRACEQLYGYPAAEAVGRDVVPLLGPPQHRAAMVATLQRIRASGEVPPPAELQLLRQDGATITVFASMMLLESPGAEPEVYFAAVDLSAQKTAATAAARSRDELRAMAVRLAEAEEAERQRLARELHDLAGRNLTALNLNLTIIRGQLPAATLATIGHRFDDSFDLIEQIATQIRDVMADLRPAVLDDYGLLAALRWYVRQFSSRTGVTVSFQGRPPTVQPPTAVGTSLFRIAQEALTNVARHARATTVTITFEATRAGELCLTVADDGVGFNPGAPPGDERRRGWGLVSMQERAVAVGGEVRVESAPGQGTRIIVRVPAAVRPPPG